MVEGRPLDDIHEWVGLFDLHRLTVDIHAKLSIFWTIKLRETSSPDTLRQLNLRESQLRYCLIKSVKWIGRTLNQPALEGSRVVEGLVNPQNSFSNLRHFTHCRFGITHEALFWNRICRRRRPRLLRSLNPSWPCFRRLPSKAKGVRGYAIQRTNLWTASTILPSTRMRGWWLWSLPCPYSQTASSLNHMRHMCIYQGCAGEVCVRHWRCLLR